MNNARLYPRAADHHEIFILPTLTSIAWCLLASAVQIHRGFGWVWIRAQVKGWLEDWLSVFNMKMCEKPFFLVPQFFIKAMEFWQGFWLLLAKLNKKGLRAKICCLPSFHSFIAVYQLLFIFLCYGLWTPIKEFVISQGQFHFLCEKNKEHTSNPNRWINRITTSSRRDAHEKRGARERQKSHLSSSRLICSW